MSYLSSKRYLCTSVVKFPTISVVTAIKKYRGSIALQVQGVTLEDGTFMRANIVVANADLPYVYNSLLGSKGASYYYLQLVLEIFLSLFNVRRRRYSVNIEGQRFT